MFFSYRRNKIDFIFPPPLFKTYTRVTHCRTTPFLRCTFMNISRAYTFYMWYFHALSLIFRTFLISLFQRCLKGHSFAAPSVLLVRLRYISQQTHISHTKPYFHGLSYLSTPPPASWTSCNVVLEILTVTRRRHGIKHGILLKPISISQYILDSAATQHFHLK